MTILSHLRQLFFSSRRNPWPQPERLNPWLDRSDAPRQIDARLRRGEIDAEQAAACQKWHDDGYLILRNVIDERCIERVLNDFEHFYATQTIIGGHRRPPQRDAEGHFIATINVHMQSQAVLEILLNPALIHWLNLLMGREMYGCQTINFFTGSRRALHQDHVHMTTKPFGYLAAAWVALEDIHPDSGPLAYVPKSQWLPFIDSKTIHTSTKPGEDPNATHDRLVRTNFEKAKLDVHTFGAKKGDVLLWHCNLVHGGAPVVNSRLSRLSMACHYAAVGVEYYHEWSGVQRDPQADLLEHNGLKYLPEYYDDDGAAMPSLAALEQRRAARLVNA